MKNQKRTLAMLVFITFSSMSLASCSASGTESLTQKTPESSVNASPTPTTPGVTVAEFEAAKTKFEIEADEFTGDIIITPKNLTPDATLFKDKLHGVSGGIDIQIVKGANTSDYEFAILSLYEGKSPLNHDEISLKSVNGVVIVDVLSSMRQNIPRDGKIFELAITNLKVSEAKAFCSLIVAEKVKARIAGSNLTTEQPVGYLTNLTQLRSGCTIWNGLQQGLKL